MKGTLAPEAFLVGHHGPREVQPGTVWSGLLRYAYGVGNWQSQVSRAQADKLETDSGVWLPSQEDSSKDLELLAASMLLSAGPKRLDALGYPGRQLASVIRRLLVEQLDETAVTDNGCWLPKNKYLTVRVLAPLAIGNHVLEQKQQVDDTRQCDTPGCAYHRHYDISLGLPSGHKELLYPNTDLYMTLPDGSLVTAWGDQLPAVDISRQRLLSLHKRAVPYTDQSNAALTPGALAHLSLIPSTGCWLTRNYHMANVAQMSNGWRADCYGRMAVPASKIQDYGGSGRSEVAHRVIARVQGRKLSNTQETGLLLNHTCAFKPCGNDLHNLQTTNSQNGIHGQMSIIAAGMALGSIDIAAGRRQLLDTSPRVHSTSRKRIKLFWDQYQDQPEAKK